MFLMQDGTWLPGDIVAPDGWSSLQFSTKEECSIAENKINENFGNSPWAGQVFGVCLDLEPDMEI